MALPEIDENKRREFQQRWRSDWIEDILRHLASGDFVHEKIAELPWYTKDNGFEEKWQKHDDGSYILGEQKGYPEGFGCAKERIAIGKWFDLGDRVYPVLDLRGLSFSDVTIRSPLNAANLEYTTFDRVKINGTSLDHARMHFCILRDVEFIGSSLRLVDMEDSGLDPVDFSRADLTGLSLSRCNIARVTFRETNLRNLDLSNAVIRYVDWDKKSNYYGVNITGASFTSEPLFERFIRDSIWLYAKKEELTKTILGKALWWLWGVTSSHGQSFMRWLIVSAFVCIGYGILYMFVPLETTLVNVNRVFAKFYFSVVTFTTLGFGDVTPGSTLAAAVVMSEVICGYLMLGALISILADKFARRG